MKILVIGSGGREHALAWKISQSNKVSKIFVAPGNAGTALEPKTENVSIDAEDIVKLLDFAAREKIDLTIVGPEAPLVAGIVDDFEEASLPCFGPSRLAAQLEGSKSFCKQFLSRHHIPTADYRSFADQNLAHQYLEGQRLPIVIKADGLAAGKGVVVAQTIEEARDAVKAMLSGNAFGEAGSQVVIEEFLEGTEASFIVMADGTNALPLATSKDHKPRDNGNQGPNTGGMGAYSPASEITEKLYNKILRDIIQPTLDGMASEGMPYSGFLYAGLMIDESIGQAKVLEFNCRFGDPETQPILMRLKTDLVEMCQAALSRELDRQVADWDDRSSLGVVMAAGGYPETYEKGHVIDGLTGSRSENLKVFHAGTKKENGRIVTNGGRVLCACALGDSINAAQKQAYMLVKSISWKDAYFRTDIGVSR